MGLYTTERGVVIRYGRVDRRDIDRLFFDIEEPQPPTEKVEVFGGIEEDVPVWDDPDYQARLRTYHLRLANEQVDLIAPAIEIVAGLDDCQQEELAAIGLGDRADLLRFAVLSEADLIVLISEILYLSTVTARGIAEAERAFDVRWHGQPLAAWPVPGSPCLPGPLFEARAAARHSGYRWAEFCELGGPEQSACVAFMRLERKVAWLLSKS